MYVYQMSKNEHQHTNHECTYVCLLSAHASHACTPHATRQHTYVLVLELEMHGLEC
jgi:hypothetical protein